MTQSQSYYQCHYCKKEIFFSDDYVSCNGKKIPLSKASRRPHRCKQRPFNRYTRRQWWEEQRRAAEQENSRREEEYRKHWNDYDYFTDEQKSKIKSNFHKACAILGVPISATRDEIKNAWRKLILKYHPDKCQDANATEKTREIIWAYENSVELETS